MSWLDILVRVVLTIGALLVIWWLFGMFRDARFERRKARMLNQPGVAVDQPTVPVPVPVPGMGDDPDDDDDFGDEDDDLR
jgi:hypothetical protein